MLDFEWRFLYLNARARELLSGGRELLGCDLWDAFPPAIKLHFWEQYHRTMEQRVFTESVSYYSEPLKCMV